MMIDPRPFAQSLLARSADDPWGAVRRLVAGGRYEALGDLPNEGAEPQRDRVRPPVRGFLYGAFLQRSEGSLYGAFMAMAAGNNQRATTLFRQVLQQLPHLPPGHDFWIPLTAFASMPTAGAAEEFELLLGDRNMLTIESLTALPLPARTNFLLFCARHQRLTAALALVDHVGPQWSPSETDFEIWAFRLASIEVLQRTGQYDRIANYGTAYKALLAEGHVEPNDRLTVEFMLASRLADAARARGDAQTAIAHFLHALQLAETGEGVGSRQVVVGDLLLKLGRYHLALGNNEAAQNCLQRCMSIFSIEGNKNYLIDALYSLGNLFLAQGRRGDARVLHARRIALMDHERSISELSRQYARLDLAKILLGTDDRATGWRLLEQIIAFSRDNEYGGQLLAACLLVRLESGRLGEFRDEMFYKDFEETISLEICSIAHFEQAIGFLTRAAEAGRKAPPRSIYLIIAKAGKRLEEAEAARVCIALLSVVRLALQFKADLPADQFFQSALKLRDGLKKGNPRYPKVIQDIQEIYLTKLQNATVRSGNQILGDWDRYVADLDRLTAADWTNAIGSIERLLDLDAVKGARAKESLQSVARGIANFLRRRDWQDRKLLASLAVRTSTLALNHLRNPRLALRLAQETSEILGKEDSYSLGTTPQSLAVLRTRAEAWVAFDETLGKLAEVEIGALEGAVGEVSESELLSRVEQLAVSADLLSLGNRLALVRVAEQAFSQGLMGFGRSIVTALGQSALPTETNGVRGAQGAGRLYLYLSNLALNKMEDPERALALARQGLGTLAPGEGDEGAEEIREALLANVAEVEVAALEQAVREVPEGELLARLERLASSGARLNLRHRLTLVRVAEQAFGLGLTRFGRSIVEALGESTLTADKNGVAGSQDAGRMYLYLSNLALNKMRDPEGAATLARQGLEALARDESGDGVEGVRQSLLENLAEVKMVDQKGFSGVSAVLHLHARKTTA